VEIAVDGLDTLSALVAGGEFDAILMDWQMPNMDGLEATREIRRLVGSQHIPVIALTANATSGDRQACLDAGMNAHLPKPVDVGQLVRTLLKHTRPVALLALEPHGHFDPPRVSLVQATGDEVPCGLAFELAPQEEPGKPEPVLDLPGALERLGGSTQLYDQVVALFRREVPNLLVDIADAARGGQRQHVKRLAHSLKGTASTVGAMAFSQAAQAVEVAFGGASGAAEAGLLAQLDAAATAALDALPAGWDLAEIP
jgi:CheY-like chemotaxis protein